MIEVKVGACFLILVQQPAKITLKVNLKIAKSLGLTMPTSILARADEVIE